MKPHAVVEGTAHIGYWSEFSCAPICSSAAGTGQVPQAVTGSDRTQDKKFKDGEFAALRYDLCAVLAHGMSILFEGPEKTVPPEKM